VTQPSSTRNNTTRRILWFVVPSLLMLLAFFPGVLALKPNADTRIFFDEKSTEYQEVVALEEEFTANNAIMFVIKQDQGDVFVQSTLTTIHQLTETLWTKSHVRKVDSLTHFNRTQIIDDTLDTDALFNPENPIDLSEIKRYAASESRLIHSILGEDLGVTAIVATLDINRSDRVQVAEVMQWANQLTAEITTKHPELSVHLAGTVVYSNTINQATKNEFSTKIPIVLCLMIIVLTIILRNIGMVLATLYVIVMTNIVTLGIAGWMGVPITPIIAFVPLSLFAIVLADAVHLITAYLYHTSNNLSRNDAIKQSLAENFQPMLITSITTAIGFLCLNLSDSPPYQYLGNLAASGSIIAFALTVFWLPHWITLFKLSSTPHAKPPAFFLIALNKPYLSMLTITGFILVIATQLPNNFLDDRIDTYFDDTWEVKRTNTLMNERLTGVHRLEYRANGSDKIPITSPTYLNALSDFRQWAMKQPNVAHVSSFDQVIKTISQQMHDNDENYYHIPNQQDLISQYFLLYELSLPFGSNLDHIVNFDKTATRIKVILYSSSSREMLAFEKDSEVWIQDNWPADMQTHAVSLETAFSALNIENSRSLISGTFLGFILIALILCFALRSIPLGILSIFANMVPAIVAFGIWGFKDGQVGLAVSIVTVITLGIVVDDTIHLLSKYQRARRNLGYTARESALYALNTTGKALLTTTVVLVACFGTLAFSHFKPNADLGFLCAVTLAIALIVDIFLFLPLVMLLGQRKDSSAKLVIPRGSQREYPAE